MQTFTVRDLRRRTGDVVRTAEAGGLSIITSKGKPVLVAVPLTSALLSEAVRAALVAKVVDDGVVTLRCDGRTTRGQPPIE